MSYKDLLVHLDDSTGCARRVDAAVRLAARPAGKGAPRMFARARTLAVGLGLRADRGTWIESGQVMACAYPRNDAALAALARQGVSVLVNLHERGHEPARLARYGLTEIHLPVRDFTPPSPEQLDRGVAAIAQAVAANQRVAGCSAANASKTMTIGTPMKAPGNPHRKAQKNTAATTMTGDIARTSPETRGSI